MVKLGSIQLNNAGNVGPGFALEQLVQVYDRPGVRGRGPICGPPGHRLLHHLPDHVGTVVRQSDGRHCHSWIRVLRRVDHRSFAGPTRRGRLPKG